MRSCVLDCINIWNEWKFSDRYFMRHIVYSISLKMLLPYTYTCHIRECKLNPAPIFVLVDVQVQLCMTNLMLLKPNLESLS